MAQLMRVARVGFAQMSQRQQSVGCRMPGADDECVTACELCTVSAEDVGQRRSDESGLASRCFAEGRQSCLPREGSGSPRCRRCR